MNAREPVLTGVTYWSSDLGPYVWHDFDAERIRHDLRTIADSGLRVVRTLLPWDVFMPATSRPDDTAMRDLETFLSVAASLELLAIPVVCAQAVGDCVFLPAYAIDVDARRPGVRAITGGVMQPGGPRDQYTDPRMLEAELSWLEALLSAFAGNPAVVMWDLGHDPATVMRPRRIDHLQTWAALLAGRLHEAGERCALTLGAADVTTARGVRLHAVAGSVDALGLAIDPRDLRFADAELDPGAVAFLLQLAMRLEGEDAALHAHVSASHGEASTNGAPEPERIRRFAGDSAARSAAVGCAGAHAGFWSDSGERAAALPPLDRQPALARRGLVDTDGSPTAFGAAWVRAIADIGDMQQRRPWPDALDVADYYANLPSSIADLYAAWQRVDDE